MIKGNNIHGVTDIKRKYIERASKIQQEYNKNISNYIKIKLPEMKYIKLMKVEIYYKRSLKDNKHRDH